MGYCPQCNAGGSSGLCPRCAQVAYAPVRATNRVEDRLERVERYLALIAEKLGASIAELRDADEGRG